MFLLDTVVLSELRKRQCDPGVASWMKSVSATDVFLSAITIGEIEIGIEKQRLVNPAFSGELGLWLERIIRTYGSRILTFDVGTARRWGRLAAGIGNKGIDLGIAATALEHGLIVVTRNVAHFTPTGVATLNPFGPAPRRKR